MLVCLSCLRSLLTGFRNLPNNVEASKELLWESSVFRKEMTAVVAQATSKVDDSTLAQLLRLAAEVADQLICVKEALLQHPFDRRAFPGHSKDSAGCLSDDDVSSACLNAAAAAEVADGLLSLLSLPAMQDFSLAHRLAASSVIALHFCLPRTAIERGLVSSSVLEVMSGTTRRAVELTAQAYGTAKPSAQLERWVCRPLVLHSFILQAVNGIEVASARKRCKGPVDKRLQRAREHLAYTFYTLLTADGFQREAQGILGDTRLLQRVNAQIVLWQQYILDHVDSRSADWHSHVKVIADVQHMPCLQHARKLGLEESYATILSTTEEVLSELGSELNGKRSSTSSSRTEEEEVRAARSALRKLRHYTSIMNEFGLEDSQ